MKTKIVGQAAVITSELKVEQIKKLARYNPKALRVIEGSGKDATEKFMVGFSEGASGAASKCGITFNATTTDGFAQVTLPIPGNVEADKRAAWAEDSLGMVAFNLRIVEEQAASALADVDGKLAAFTSNLVVE